ncbi:MAG: hypothetical protein HQL03_02355 [Nitrospirae bacterium]|nr:hypothetical protein [Nitrospirota bacterium]
MSDIDIEAIEKSISSIGQSGLTYDCAALDGLANKDQDHPATPVLNPPPRYRSELRRIKNKINASMAIHNRMPELTHRELRLLAYDHDLPINNKSIYIRLLEAIKAAGISSCLLYKNLLFVYFKRYRYFIEHQALLLPLKELWLSWGQGAQDACDLSNVAGAVEVYFSSEAPLNIARCILGEKEKDPRNQSMHPAINTLLLRHHLLPGTDDLLTETYNSIINLCLDGFSNPLYLNVLLYEVLLPNSQSENQPEGQSNKGIIDKARSREIVSELLRLADSFVTDKAACEKKLKRYFMTQYGLGDPRNPCCTDNWSGVDEQSISIFRRWLVEDDIVFFFKFLSDDRNDAYGRRSLWLRLANSIQDSRIFISNYHYNARREVIERARQDGREPSSLHCDSGRLNSSCIAFNLDNLLYAIEFTEPDTALYIYHKEVFDIDLTQDKLNISDLKKIDAPTATQNTQMMQFYYHTSYPALRFYHSNNWQLFVEKYLSLYNIKAHPS